MAIAKAGPLIDKLYQQDQVIDEIEAELRKAKRVRAALEAKLMDSFGEQSLDGALGKVARARITFTKNPSIKNRPKFLKFVIANKAYDLFQNRVSSKAYFDRLEDGIRVPGVDVFTNTRISVTKVKSR